MSQNFDMKIDRLHSASIKWERLRERFGREDLLSFWATDMDFRCPPEVISALHDRVEHGIFGYTFATDEDDWAQQGWLSRRHSWVTSPEDYLYSSGVLTSARICVLALSEPGDGVIVQPPIYPPLRAVPELVGRRLMENPLVQNEDGHWQMDFDHLNRCFEEGGRMLLLCSPHSPVGRVWTEEELTRVYEIVHKYRGTVIADEIHHDIVFSGHKHTSFLSLPGTSRLAISLISAEKTFNLSGLRFSSIVVPDSKKRVVIQKVQERMFGDAPNIFGMKAQAIAYEMCDYWLDDLLGYIERQRHYAINRLEADLPGLRVTRSEGSYLLWLDMRCMGLSSAAIERWAVQEAGVALARGDHFGEGGEGFMRMNIACPREQLDAAIDNMSAVWK